MFNYYGTKSKLAALYDDPIYDTIIEPFSGAAAYSLYGNRWEKEVILYDSNPKIYAVWRYLIEATPNDILSLPDLSRGQKVTDFNLSDGERWLIGFCINRGSSCPKITVGEWSSWNKKKLQLSTDVHKVKHWAVFNSSYESCLNRKATWFIDPPYQQAGKYYFGHKQMNFNYLAEWCKSRIGQIIVCENEGADWLPFRFLSTHHGSIRTRNEVIYTAES